MRATPGNQPPEKGGSKSIAPVLMFSAYHSLSFADLHVASTKPTAREQPSKTGKNRQEKAGRRKGRFDTAVPEMKAPVGSP